MPMTDTKVRNAKPKDKQFKLFDTDGLFLLVSPAGGKWWRFKYRFGGKEKLISLGTYPEVSLSQARARRDAARKQVADGIDPSQARKALKAANLKPSEVRKIPSTKYKYKDDIIKAIIKRSKLIKISPKSTGYKYHRWFFTDDC